ncbi:ComE operon protein 1 [Limihaloglobus sulfuriphilus]|uniref:ComE operon protein 1 n=1 Tax=Limihaloglobus sulfuriphilus TaxID=1851148 RepID=A0A1Q2MDS4_9BACT|nr:helix-hairpin-helix domain-containing protein [Limihaloglobus sulfuriphilus]AQQ70794.1 ComE operon protein 1 [Limihaloglobus sulfuriphilus]
MSVAIKGKTITETALLALSAVMFASAAAFFYFPVSDSGPDPEGLSELDINEAGLTQLELIEGIGPATAAAIIKYRDEISETGKFQNADELINVKGIGEVKARTIAEIAAFKARNKRK